MTNLYTYTWHTCSFNHIRYNGCDIINYYKNFFIKIFTYKKMILSTYRRWRSSGAPRRTTHRPRSRTSRRRIGRPTCRRLCTAATWTGPTVRASHAWPSGWPRTQWAVRSLRRRRRTWATRPGARGPPPSPRPTTTPPTAGRDAAGAWRDRWQRRQIETTKSKRRWRNDCENNVLAIFRVFDDLLAVMGI